MLMPRGIFSKKWNLISLSHLVTSGGQWNQVFIDSEVCGGFNTINKEIVLQELIRIHYRNLFQLVLKGSLKSYGHFYSFPEL